MMSRVRFVPAVAATAAALLLAACASDRAAGPTQSATLGKLLSEASLSNLDGATSSIIPTSAARSSAFAPALPGLDPATCPYDGREFVCQRETVDGFTVNRSFTLLDASNAPQSQYDAATTAAVHASTSVVGSFTINEQLISFDEHQDVTLSGLLAGVHALDGTAVVTVTAPASGPVPAMNSKITRTLGHLVLPGTSGGYPSGSLTVDDEPATSTLPRTQPTTHLVLLFDGTSTAKATLSIAGAVVSSCTLDLAAQMQTCH